MGDTRKEVNLICIREYASMALAVAIIVGWALAKVAPTRWKMVLAPQQRKNKQRKNKKTGRFLEVARSSFGKWTPAASRNIFDF